MVNENIKAPINNNVKKNINFSNARTRSWNVRPWFDFNGNEKRKKNVMMNETNK